ncbi:hypothetical protein [Pelagerythrobacter aerophilus]|uniref:hypothetical protein n=1 Tax=Pelagerythrobacter aerophilus TaxID=2306995 RepID=UPI0011C3637F|nr:hypothetical protein [Pelagerythrobacter aerophilus]
MVCIRDGYSASRKGRSRPILTLKRGSNGSEKNALLGGGEQPEYSGNRSELQRFEDALWSARNRWDIARRALPSDADGWIRGVGLFGRGRIKPADADKLLRKAFAALEDASPGGAI